MSQPIQIVLKLDWSILAEVSATGLVVHTASLPMTEYARMGGTRAWGEPIRCAAQICLYFYLLDL